MEKPARHRPQRQFPDAPRLIIACDRETCLHCGQPLLHRKTWYVKKYVQTLDGPLFPAGKSHRCGNPDCPHPGATYYASGLLAISLPYSTYGLDVLAFSGRHHEHNHRQLVEIQRDLVQRGLLINERTVGKLYRQFLALLGGMTTHSQQRLQAAVQLHGGLIWAIDALQPEGSDPPLYVLYQVLSHTPVSALQESNPTTERLRAWLEPFTQLYLSGVGDPLGWRESGRCSPQSKLEPGAPPTLSTAFPQQHRQRCLGSGWALAPTPAPRTRRLGGCTPRRPRCAALASRRRSHPPFASVKRDAGLIAIEQSVRLAIRDAVNRSSRKPFAWGGVAGYDQLDAIAQALHQVPNTLETSYLRQFLPQVDRALAVNQALADDVRTAHQWLCRIAECLHYGGDAAQAPAERVSSDEIRQAMDSLLAQFRPDPKQMPAQAALECAWHRLWKAWSGDVLTCYDVPGLPADNLQLEAFFNRIRKHERRISGRASTRPLGSLGTYQVLFIAESEQDLLEGIRQVALVDYQAHRQRLAQRESPRQQRYRLHHDPAKAIQTLLEQHTARRATIAAAGPAEGI